jgi:ABC-type uncharacterized transport system YnjBCD ATPase subunit
VSFHAKLQGRTLVLTDASQRVLLTVPLDTGGRHRLVVHEGNTVPLILEALETVPGVGVLPADGGLLSDVSVADNLSLALRYGVKADAATVRGWEATLQRAFRACGWSHARINTIGRELPMNLERTERWLIGFVRHLLRPSELLVLDRIFLGLSRRQSDAVLAMQAVHHEFHPTRPALFIDLDAYDLPTLADCQITTELEPVECPS